ncbi:MAG TPA: molybdopterin molybdenumtransferase MoeA, partial [Bacteroidetes bacterium]|nr:molybdopterin molybdenumtransferase MoeA [Bacteroidota bacterium]
MINASSALKIVLENAPLLAVENVSLLDSLGRVPSHDIIASQDLPPFNNSSMDGFAVASSDLRRASAKHPRTLKVIGESSAGRAFAGKVTSGQVVRVMTGALIPKGADAVVPIEKVVECETERVRFLESPKPGQHIRSRGEDIRRGQIVLKSGMPVTSAALAVLAACGYSRLRVRRKPRVSILPTGNELVGITEKPKRGQIRCSSSYALAGYVEGAGGIPKLLGIAPDTKSRLRKGIKAGLDSDVLLVT